MEIRLTIPGELTDLNTYISAERTNRHIAANIKKEMTELCYYCIKSQCKTSVNNPVFVKIRWYCKDKRKDPDNVAFGKKFLMDALVAARVLKNDGWKQVMGFREDFFVDANNPRVEIELKEVQS